MNSRLRVGFELVLIVLVLVLQCGVAPLAASGEFLREKHWAYLNITSKNGVAISNLKKNIILADAALYGIQSSKRVVSGQLIQIRSRPITANTKTYTNPDASSMFANNAFGRMQSGSSGSQEEENLIVDEISGRISAGADLRKSSAFSVDNKGCTDYLNRNLPDQYIALVSRGDCTFDHKLMIAMRNNASAIIIYNTEQDLFTMFTRNSSIVNVLVPSYIGSLLGSWIDQVETYVTITPGPVNYMSTEYFGPTRSNIVFVFGTFAVVIIIGFLWLVVYFIQKYRLANAKKNLNKKLRNAMMTALQKMKLRQLKPGDMELNEVCAICLENYQPNDCLRTLPCNHYFHQKDIDLWLIENRSCPMCKLDVLKAYGIELSRNQNMFTRVVRQICERPARMHIRSQQQHQMRLRAQQRIVQQRVVVNEVARQETLVVDSQTVPTNHHHHQQQQHQPNQMETSTVILIPPLNVSATPPDATANGVNNDAMSVTSIETVRIDSTNDQRRMKLGESSNNRISINDDEQRHNQVEGQATALITSPGETETSEVDRVSVKASKAAVKSTSTIEDESTNEIVLHSFNPTTRQNVDRKLHNSSFVDIQL